jgi:uncharacterized protein YcnI
MSVRTTARLGATTATLAAVALIASPAAAHVSATPSVAEAGAYTVLTMGVPHGCDGSPTTKLEIQIPEHAAARRPARHPGALLPDPGRRGRDARLPDRPDL